MEKIKVILVDDHAVVRAGYKILLSNIENISVVAETNTGEDAIRLSREHNPDVIVCLLYTSPSPRDGLLSRMPSSA